jgi:hypothetical protein
MFTHRNARRARTMSVFAVALVLMLAAVCALAA